MASTSNNTSTTASSSQAQGVRHSVRQQTRTNPSRTSKTAARSFSSLYGQPSTDAHQTPSVPHGFYPALTHFTDAITALPREFRRHNSLLKEVDAKAWALEENLLHLLTIAADSEPVPCPPNPAPIVDGVIRDYALPPDAPVESQESKNRRLLFDRIRRTLSDLMMTADEKNHVITNANDELDHQLFRLDSIFPYIAGEISEESRLGSLNHWAYSNRSNAKTAGSTANERPRREAASNNTAHLVQALHEAEAASRSEARREAALARKHRRNHAESDFDETRAGGARKGAVAKTTDAVAVSTAAPAKRRRVEKPQPAPTGAAMERSLSGVNSAGRATSKDAAGSDAKKRARAPNAVSAAGRKRNNTVTSNAGSPSAVSSPVVGTFNPPRNATSPGPNAPSRPQSSRAQQNASQATNARQRPPSSASNRVNSSNKSMDSKANNTKEGSTKEGTPQAASEDGNHNETESANTDAKAPVATVKDDPSEEKTVDESQAIETAAHGSAGGGSTSKGRSSKNSTPVLSTVEPHQSRTRPSRSNNDSAPAKRSHKKSGSILAAAAAAAATEDEESSREGDDEDDEGEPRYCYCNEISFGEMVACDNDACPREWFHLSCVGLTKPPGKNVKWYCNECKENMKRGRSNGGR